MNGSDSSLSYNSFMWFAALTHAFNKRIAWIQIKKPYMKSAAYNRYPQCAASAAASPPIV